MEQYLERIIRAALADARAAGLDYLGQTQTAVREVTRTRPDLKDHEIHAAVDRVNREVSA